MTCKRIAAWTLCLSILCFLAAAAPSLASPPQVATDVPLVPVDGSGFVMLRACIFLAEMSCEDADCVLRVRQTYQLHNSDRVEGATLRLGVPSRVGDETVQMPELTLQDEKGEALAPISSDELYGSIWEVELDPNARETLVLSYVHPTCHGHLVRWCWAMPLLSSWGGVESARVALKLPQYTTDDAFLLLEPYPCTFDGTTLSWEYENPEISPPHELVMLSPPTWRQLNDLRASGAHRDLADLYIAVQEAAEREGAPFSDHFDQILAELEAALNSEPDDVDTRVELAELLQARGDTVPEMRLNYLLLSVEELARAMKLRPGDRELADLLSRVYFDAARVASESDDPGAALIYLRKAGEVSGSAAGRDYVSREDLFLRWALSLAQQGRVSEAMAQLDGVLRPEAQDVLLHYAPPLMSARTEVEMSPTDRVARYWFQLYPASAGKTQMRIEEIARHLKTVEGCEVALRSEADASVLELRVPYESLSQLDQRASDLLEALSMDLDLVTSFVAAPWRSLPETYGTEHGFARDVCHYEEHVDLASMQDVWEAESEYVRWRLIELRNSSPQDERERLWQSLGLIALREQSRVWEHLPSGSYWVYRVDCGESTGGSRSFSWLVPWGLVRDLQVTWPTYRWSRVSPVLALVAGAVSLVAGISHLVKRHRALSS